MFCYRCKIIINMCESVQANSNEILFTDKQPVQVLANKNRKRFSGAHGKGGM